MVIPDIIGLHGKISTMLVSRDTINGKEIRFI